MHTKKMELNEGLKKQLADHVGQFFTGPVAEQVVERAVLGLEKKVETFISSLTYEKLYRYAKPSSRRGKKPKLALVSEESRQAENAKSA